MDFEVRWTWVRCPGLRLPGLLCNACFLRQHGDGNATYLLGLFRGSESSPEGPGLRRHLLPSAAAVPALLWAVQGQRECGWSLSPLEEWSPGWGPLPGLPSALEG